MDHTRIQKLLSYRRVFFIISLSIVIAIVGSVRQLSDARPKIVLSSISICPNGKIRDINISATDYSGADISNSLSYSYKNQTLTITASDSAGNTSIRHFPVAPSDTSAPVLSLSEPDSYSILKGESPNFPPVTATDDCDPIDVSIEGSFDKDTPGTYILTYTATDSSGNSSSITRTIVVNDIPPNSGIIYLTFDDGPSPYTDTLLDILAKYDVKATFFVTSSGSDESIKRAFEEGHTIGLHTSSHNYSYLYSDIDSYFSDLYEIQSRVESITGAPASLIRFPGGSSNTISASYDGGSHIMSSLVNEVSARGFTYFDWNISSGDAGGAYTSAEVAANVINNLRWDGISIVLQHDTKDFSVDAVAAIIEYGLRNGFTFLPLSPSSPTIHHAINN